MSGNAKTDRSLDLFGLLKNGGLSAGIKIVEVTSAEPNAYAFIFKGTAIALGLEVFEVPIEDYPLRIGDKFLAYPLVSAGQAQRWALLKKINGGSILGTMVGSGLQVDGVGTVYSSSKVVIAPGTSVTSGYRVKVDPILDSGTIKYLVSR